jgi:hypothetical protein
VRATNLLCLLSTLTLNGCLETDGPPLSESEVTQTSCGKGALKRSAVSADVVGAFYPCCEGRGHFIPKLAVPQTFHAMLAPGPDGETLCIPDEIATDPDYSPRACTSLFGLEGACISTCIPMVLDQPVPLPQDVCASDERCAPCVHPLTKEETGACGIGERACTPFKPLGKCDTLQPTMDLSKLASCCPEGKAHCAPKDLVSSGADGFNMDEFLALCPDGKSYCVPDEILARGGKHQPPTCKSAGGREGRCISICVKAIAEQKETLPVDICQPHERCAPCFDPRTGIASGACTLGPCDAPKEDARPFEPCGSSAGQKDAICVPAELVPAKDRCRFDTKGCLKGASCAEPGAICVPKKMVDSGPTFEPKKCTASMSGILALLMTVLTDYSKAMTAMTDYSDGRCISKCLPQVRDNSSASMLGSSGCDPDEICVPCFDPTKISQGKVATGACDREACPGS